jgi:hypothetical protein
VVQNQVDARPRHKHGQPSQKLDGVEHHVRRPIAPRLPELQPHLSLVGQVEPLLGHGRTQRIAARALEPLPLPGRDDEARMQIEPVRPRVTASVLGRLALLLGRLAQTTKASAPLDGKLMWRQRNVANRTANITTPVFFYNKVFCTSAYGTERRCSG